MPFKWKPMPGKVVVEILPPKERTGGKIILLETTREESNMGTVIAVPEDAVVDGTLMQPFVAVGDIIVFGKYAGTSVVNGENRDQKLVIMREVDILTIVEADAPITEAPAIPTGEYDDPAGPPPETLDPAMRGEEPLL